MKVQGSVPVTIYALLCGPCVLSDASLTSEAY